MRIKTKDIVVQVPLTLRVFNAHIDDLNELSAQEKDADKKQKIEDRKTRMNRLFTKNNEKADEG